MQEAVMSLPTPSGYRVLVAIPKVEEKTAGGIYRPTDTRKTLETASIVAQVVSLGPDAYSDPDKFPSGPWCKPGNFVMMRAYSGTRFIVEDQEYRLINDDTVEAVTDEPGKIERPNL